MRNNKLNNKIIFIISLDVELLWGSNFLYPAFLHNVSKARNLLQKDGSNGRNSINFILQLFEKYEIAATWAVVGHLFLNERENYNKIAYDNCRKFINHPFYDIDVKKIENNQLYYGEDIIKKILSSHIKHEIGYHSLSHLPFTEISKKMAQNEIKEGLNLAKRFGIKPTSFVFPYDKINHIDVLKENGFNIYRGVINSKANMNQNFLIRRFNWILDKFISEPVEPVRRNDIWEIPSSLCFHDPLFQYTLYPKALEGISKSIKKGNNSIFHIYMHPHNLIKNIFLQKKLNQFLKYISEMRNQKKLIIMTMDELALKLNKEIT